MELLILIICLLILAETSVLVLKHSQKPLLPYVSKRKIYVDTSALMDQRLLRVMETGFISDDLYITRSVIHELQLLADGKDRDRRVRARYGLDAIRDLERVVHFNTNIVNDPLDRTPVDDRLLELAKENRGSILTNDYNLQKVAIAEHIETLNLNELALVLKHDFVPGEHVTVKIITTGSGQKQGVGYLKDGTMVVVDHASQYIGQNIEIELLRTSQTAAGTMAFAKVFNITSGANKKSPASKLKSKKSSQKSSAKTKPEVKQETKSESN